MFRLICLLIGYALGCIQSAYIIGKLAHGIDIRDHGSKSSGFTNANRVMGFKTGVWIFIADVGKAVLAFLVASWIFDGGGSFLSPDAYNGLLPGVWAGLGVVLGHNFPVFMKFRGGKGIACTLGIVLMLDYQVALIAFVVGIILVVVFKYISLASLAITLVWPFLLLSFGRAVEIAVFCAAISALAWYMHRENISRLLSGTERKFKLGK